MDVLCVVGQSVSVLDTPIWLLLGPWVFTRVMRELVLQIQNKSRGQGVTKVVKGVYSSALTCCLTTYSCTQMMR